MGSFSSNLQLRVFCHNIIINKNIIIIIIILSISKIIFDYLCNYTHRLNTLIAFLNYLSLIWLKD